MLRVLEGVLPRYETVATTLEVMADTHPFEDVVNRLLAAEMRSKREEPLSQGQEKALMSTQPKFQGASAKQQGDKGGNGMKKGKCFYCKK